MSWSKRIFPLTAFRIVVIYLILSWIWIVVSDRLVEFLFANPETVAAVQTWKGLLFVTFTALLLYALMRRSEIRLNERGREYESVRRDLMVRSEEQYRRLFQQNPSPMWIYRPADRQVLEVNQAAMDLYGYSRDEFSSMTLFDFHPPEEHPRLKRLLDRGLKGLVKVDGWTHVTKDGEKKTVNVAALDIRFNDQDCRLVVANDVTRQREAEKQVIHSLMEGVEAERRRIAKELHDSLGQYLAAAGMNLESVSGRFEGEETAHARQYRKGLRLLKDAVIETRRISQNLMPKTLEDFGLGLAVSSWIDEVGESYDVEVDFRENIGGRSLGDRVELNVYRIVQESLTNAIRHSGCSRVDVQLQLEGEELVCTVEDDGGGFDPEEKREEGMGLTSIRNRVSLLGGELDLSSRPGVGTCLTVTVPVNSVS